MAGVRRPESKVPPSLDNMLKAQAVSAATAKAKKQSAQVARMAAKAVEAHSANVPKSAARKVTDTERKQMANALNGLTPLEFACSMMRDPAASIPEKQWACAILMPYLHRKMPIAVDIGGQQDNPINVRGMNDLELKQFIELCQKAGISLPTGA